MKRWLLCGALMLCACARERTAQPAPLGDRVKCANYPGLPAAWGRDAHAGMIQVPGGSFQFGSERGYADERPLAAVRVDSLWIDRTEVTNAQFASFVAATRYVTEAERSGGSAVFTAPSEGSSPPAPGSWWYLEPGATWRHPEGSSSNIVGRDHEPVVDITYADAVAYAHWLGRELPTETQWEYAAKAGRLNEDSDRALRDAQGRPQANFWQGLFPLHDRAEDGFAGRAPVGCFAANPYGLHDMVGNVWEWTADLYGQRGTVVAVENDAIPAMAVHGGAIRRVIKGGSFLCAANYCARARASSRQGQEIDLPASHLGFRTVLSQ